MSTKSLIAKSIGTSFGFGYLPVAPGTFGALFGVLIYYVLHHFIPESLDWTLIALILLFTVLGTWACSVVIKEWGHDPSKIVMDETIGVWITLLFIPFNHWYIWLAFGLFRLFDIWKPLGIKSIDEKMDTSFSVMLDDIVAGIYAMIVLQGIIYFMS
ncbi:MAG: phosphatidylglycerophosphatase A [Saprospiraceae bacterium]|nr:phosphatidylglycerophosphatase A [Saprospiraceae bacterium]